MARALRRRAAVARDSPAHNPSVSCAAGHVGRPPVWRGLMPLAVCATPIGNLADITLRALSELAAAETILCEDTRHTRVLLRRHGVEGRLLSYREHNEAARTAELMPRL